MPPAPRGPRTSYGPSAVPGARLMACALYSRRNSGATRDVSIVRRSLAAPQPPHVGPQRIQIAGLETLPVGGHLEHSALEEEAGEQVGLESGAHPVLDPLSELPLVPHQVGKVAAVPRGDVALERS